MERPSFVKTLLFSCIGLLTAAGVWIVRTHQPHLEPGTAGWGRLVMGATPSGAVHELAVISLAGIDRRQANHLKIRIDRPNAVVRLSFDQAEMHSIRMDRNGEATAEMPAADVPGARIDLLRVEGEPLTMIQAVTVAVGGKPSYVLLAIFAALSGLTTVVLVRRKGIRLGIALGCVTAALLTIFSTPALVFLNAPSSGSVLRLLIPATWLGASLLFVYTTRTRLDRRFFWKAALTFTAIVFGWWVRWYFLPSAGSWDTEYWKAWMMRTVSHGVTRVYGDNDAVPEGQFVDQLLGREKQWQVSYYGRDFVVDYPPLAMALWRGSWWTVSTLMPWWNYSEAQNVAVKLPSVLGDILAVGVLLIALRRRSRLAWTLGLLYWTLPVSWLSSGILGFLDGAYVPLAVGALLAAALGRGASAGGLLALAALIKPQGAIVAPAAAIALWNSNRRSLPAAIGTGLGVAGLAIGPFYVMGTLSEAIVHVFRILFQQRLSAGFANPWWIIGHISNVMNQGIDILTQPVAFTHIGDVALPARPIALILFVLATLWICWIQRRSQGTEAACLAGACVFFSYSMLAMGVHHNHPHLIFLALLATGLSSLRLRYITAALSVSYVLNLLMLSGVGRFYGPRHLMLVPLGEMIRNLRVSLGFDLTLLLAILNTVLFGLLMLSLRTECDRTKK